MPTAAEIVDEWLAREIESTKDGTKATLGQFLANGYVNGRETRQTVESIAQILGAAKTGVLARVAALQAAVASIQNAESVDAAAVASTVVDSLKALVWGVK